MENEITIDKIIEKSKQWTLEGDCTLLQWMNQISNNLEERVTKTSSDIINMSTRLDRTSIALSNATNNLAALQYSKFVENRVHEDDETLASTAHVPSEDVNDKKNSNQDVYSFLKKNVEMMNSCHEAYSFSYEDSEDDDDEPVTSVVYRSKNPYEARPLPHIYGSNMWKEKWHIGLCDSDNDFSVEENSEQFSESSSTADDSYDSTAPTMSEWDSAAWGLNTQHNVERKDMNTPSNDGESSYQGEDYSQSKMSTPRLQKNIPNAQQPIQDQRYYQHIPRRQENLFDDIFDNSKPQEVPAQVVVPQVLPPNVVTAPLKKIIPESYIPNEPPPDEHSIESESNRRVGAKKTLNLFDDDEFSSFMDQIVQKATNKNITSNEQSQDTSEQPKKSSAANIFNDVNDHVHPDNNNQNLPKKTLVPNLLEEPNVNKQKQLSKPLASNIFTDSDDLFSPPIEKAQEPPTKTVAPNLFNDSDYLFAPSLSEQPIVKRKSSSPILEVDTFTASQKSVGIIGKTKIKNLFDDDDEDDDFDNIFSPKPNTSNTFNQATKNLFSDDLAVESEHEEPTLENVESIKENPTASLGVINEDKNNIVFKNENASKVSLLKDTPIVQKNIFDDGDHRSPIVEKKISFGTPKSKEVSLLKKGLFDDFDEFEDENNIFSIKPAKSDLFDNLFQKENPDNKLSTIPNKTLFGNEDEDNKSPESKRLDLVEENSEKKSISNTANYGVDDLPKELIDDIFPPSSNIKKTQLEDIFADVVEDFEDLVAKNPSKANKVNEEFTKIPESSTNAPKPTEPTTMSVTTPKLPAIAVKPLVDKTSKPQSKVMSKQDFKENGLNNTGKNQEKEQISSTNSEGSRPNLEPIDPPQLSETAKTPIAKLSSTLDMNISDTMTKQEEVKDKTSFVEEENTQSKVIFKSEEEGSKPVPKLKPKVIIEHDDKSSPSKDITDEKSLADQSIKKPSTIPSYTSLFHDDIPPEDENPNPTSNEESPLHTVEEDVEAKPISSASSVPYSSINLFADVPPDDYFLVSTPPPVAQSKRIHSVFYDDFNETIEAGREMRTPTSYIINDEPPPDEKDNKPVISEVKKEKPVVSKLKKLDFQINVGALLPSAKLPTFKKPETILKSQSDTKIIEQNSPSVKSVINNYFISSQLRTEIKTRELPENILPNLNKNRVKVQVKRRPSTRSGRQESYRKSMIEETVSIANQEEQEIKKSISSSLFDDFENVIQEREIKLAYEEMSKDKKEIMEPLVSSSLFEDLGTFDKKQETIKDSKGSLNKMPDQATLFEESDILFNKNVTSSSSSKATTTNIPSLFQNSDSEAENIFGSNTKKSELETSPMTKKLDSLFDSDEIDENPFGTPKNFLPHHPINPKDTNKPPEEKSKMDLLFESVQPKELKSQPVKTAFKPSEESAKTTPKSLFGDSDDGSDDLFKEARVSKKAVSSHRKPEQKPKTKQAKSSASLFSSDEGSESGGDIFGKTKSATQRTKKKEPVKDKASSNLFADLSDDDSDDLFGTSTKVNKSKTNPPKNRVQSTKQPAQAQQAKAISSNPLSDLLGP